MSTEMRQRMIEFLRGDSFTTAEEIADRFLAEFAPRWIKADPDRPETWPEEGVRFLAFHSGKVGLHTMQSTADDPDLTLFDLTNAWSDPDPIHWMPWSLLGDPE